MRTITNLLPWRDRMREDQQKELIADIVICSIIALALVAVAHLNVDLKIQQQVARNNFLELESKHLDTKIASIAELKSIRQSLTNRMNIVQNLQQSRPGIVKIYEGLAKSTPDGVRLKSIKQEGRSIQIKGSSQSNARVSSYMRKLQGSGLFETPHLKFIKNEANINGDLDFVLNLKKPVIEAVE